MIFLGITKSRSRATDQRYSKVIFYICILLLQKFIEVVQLRLQNRAALTMFVAPATESSNPINNTGKIIVKF